MPKHIKKNIKRLFCSHFHSCKVVVETTPPVVINVCKECGKVTAQWPYKDEWNKLIEEELK